MCEMVPRHEVTTGEKDGHQVILSSLWISMIFTRYNLVTVDFPSYDLVTQNPLCSLYYSFMILR